MKANELMIADFVKYYDCNLEKECYAQVTSIQADGTEPFVQTSDSDVYYLAETYKPIPLTAEILKKNGFDIHETLGEWHPSINGFRFVNKYSDEPLEIDACGLYVEIRYVHQLQHALRLCGLNDLADNFKI